MDKGNAIKASFWQGLCPSLHITTDTSDTRAAKRQRPEPRDIGFSEAALRHDGFWCSDHVVFQEEKDKLNGADTLAKAAETVMRAGYPPNFLLVFDEVWDAMEQVYKQVPALEKNGLVPNCDILIFHVAPAVVEQAKKGEFAEANLNEVPAAEGRLPFSLPHGFSPHRDRQPEDARASFTPSGFPKYFTSWIALTHANPSNSCMYMIPAWADPGYFAGDVDEIDPMQRALSEKESYQHIRSFPLPPGGSVMFSHRILHWGSHGNPKALHTPRIALSFAWSTPDYEPAYLTDTAFQAAKEGDLSIRVRLAAAQCLCYQDRFLFSPSELKTLLTLAKGDGDLGIFHDTYKSKFMMSFTEGVDRIRPGAEGTTTRGGGGTTGGGASTATGEAGGDGDDAGSVDSELEDARLEALLEAEAGGALVDEDFSDSDAEEEGGLA